MVSYEVTNQMNEGQLYWGDLTLLSMLAFTT
jgi:hypothetical protein